MLLRYLIVGVVITILLIVLSYFFVTYCPVGHRIETLSFEALQGQFSTFDPKHDLPVVVVDIGAIKTIEPRIDGHKDRGQLLEVIRAIADQNPQAIGVDILFSPKDGQWRTPEDEGFLEECLKISHEKDVPIFVGVDKEMPLGNPAGWLGSEKFRPMAATIAVYREDAKRIPLWVKEKSRSEALPSLSFSLSQSVLKHGEKKPPPPFWLRWAIETIDDLPGRIEESDEIEHAEALVNYSKLGAIQQTDLLTMSETSVREFGPKFNERVVILGNGRVALDKFGIPGHLPTSGVYVHASAAYTLIKEPIYELRWTVRVILDALFSAFILLTVARRRWKTDFDWHRYQRRLTWGVGFVILLLAFFLARIASVLWLDFVVIMLALLLHPWLEDKIEYLWEKYVSSPGKTTEKTQITPVDPG